MKRKQGSPTLQCGGTWNIMLAHKPDTEGLVSADHLCGPWVCTKAQRSFWDSGKCPGPKSEGTKKGKAPTGLRMDRWLRPLGPCGLRRCPLSALDPRPHTLGWAEQEEAGLPPPCIADLPQGLCLQRAQHTVASGEASAPGQCMRETGAGRAAPLRSPKAEGTPKVSRAGDPHLAELGRVSRQLQPPCTPSWNPPSLLSSPRLCRV